MTSDREPSAANADANPGLAINFRDFGGMESRHGGRVVNDRLFRSGHMAAVTAEEAERLLGLDFALIADLRYAGERSSDPSPWPETLADRIFAHDQDRTGIAPHMMLLHRPDCRRDDIRLFYLDLYRELPFYPFYRSLFAAVVDGMARADGRVLIHCTAGKDRTGMLVGLTLHLLGVDRDAIVADYMRTAGNPALWRIGQPIRQQLLARHRPEQADELVSALLNVHEDYLNMTFQTIEERCGSVENYFQEAGVDPAAGDALRRRYLAN